MVSRIAQSAMAQESAKITLVLAFGAFFAVFEITRQVSSIIASQSREQLARYGLARSKTISKVLNACTLVTGGVRVYSPLPARSKWLTSSRLLLALFMNQCQGRSTGCDASLKRLGLICLTPRHDR